ncbi:helix-turn-helix transcriptional regulator [Clostridium oceanicum]|uniref:HTH cro/C1-type domain-containing protein n=1 Tax=Clostridium oceanicum TaxID=1543 RepID=A0ABN1JC31_9CLOT
MATFGERLRSLRQEKEYSIRKLAELLNFGKTTIANWEKDNRFPDRETILKLANFFNVTTDYLLGRTDDSNSKIFKSTIDGHKYEMEIDKSYPYDLDPNEVEDLLKNLESVGFDVNKLIEKIKKTGN